MIEQALILAAGRGVRLVPDGLGPPKPLVELGGRPILSHVLARLEAAGLTHATVVLGHRAEEIENYFRQAAPARIEVCWLAGANPDRSNGMSVLHARPSLRQPFLLLMADHLVEAAVLRRLAGVALGADACVLGVDRKLERVFDREEATKVKLDGERVLAIGKELAEYDAIDTGVFACTPALFGALEAGIRNNDCSLSDGIRELARRGVMRALDIGDAEWIDVDTPEALRQAEALLRAGKLSC